MSVPKVTVSKTGKVEALDDTGAHVLGAHAGQYSILRAGGILLFTPDAGTGAGPRDGEHVAMAGDVRAMPLLGLLNLLGQNRETGRLVVKRGPLERVIMLREGDIASVGSNAAEDRLGRFLVRLGKITEQQLHDALSEASYSSKRLGQILVHRGWLDAHDLWATIQEQITEIFSEVVNWEEGSFVLYRLDGDYRFPSTPPLSMQGLLLEAVRRADEMSRFRDLIPDGQTWVRRTEKTLPDSNVDDFERITYDAVVEQTKITDLCKRLHASEFDTTRAVYGLVRIGVLEVAETRMSAGKSASGPFHFDQDHQSKMEVFNLAFCEIRDEVVRNGRLDAFMVGVLKYMSNPDGAYRDVFRGVTPDPAGSLDANKIEQNLASLEVPDPFGLLTEALNELTFFMLFQCGELLDAQSDENLGRRVRLIHSALSGTSAV